MGSLDFYDCTYQACQLREGKFQEFDIVVFNENPYELRFCAHPLPENGLMLLKLYASTDTAQCPLDLGVYEILNCNEESMQSNLLPLLSYMFLGLFLPQSRVPFDTSELESWDTEAGIIESTKYKRVFNALFSAMCSFHFSDCKGLGEDELNAIKNKRVPKILAKAQRETLLLIEPAGTHRFMVFLAPYCPYYMDFCSAWIFAYTSSVGRFWKIESYSPLLSLQKMGESRIAERKLPFILSGYLVNCVIQFEHHVNVHPDFIEVCLQMDNVRCDVLPVDRDAPKERHLPAKICLLIGPENGRGVHSVSFSESSPNPIIDITNGHDYEASFQIPHKLGVKGSTSTTVTKRFQNWGFEQSPFYSTFAQIDWTRYDPTTGKPVYDKKPPKSSFLHHKTLCNHRNSKVYRAFTQQGGVVFAKDGYGKPLIWRFNRDLEGHTLKWIVQASVWLTYSPDTQYLETRSHCFSRAFCLKLETTSTPN